MGLPNLIWLHFIADKDYNTYYIDNGVVIKSNVPAPLSQHPSGWKDIEIAFGTNQKYFSLNRSYTVPLKYVGDGATILRSQSYKGKGYEEELYAIILRWDRETGIHKLEYRGRIDMSKMVDDPVTGVTVNTIEGGLLSYLNANDGTTYEIVCDETNPKAIIIRFDGVSLKDLYNFTFIEGDLEDRSDVLPTVFLNNEGDSVGIVKGDQQQEHFTSSAYFIDSLNYIFSSAISDVTVRIRGQIGFDFKEGVDPGDGHIDEHVALITNLNQVDLTWLVGDPLGTGEGYEYVVAGKLYDFDVTKTLVKGERLFIVNQTEDITQIAKLLESRFTFEFTTKNAESFAYALKPLDLLQTLVSNMTGGLYTAQSAFFTAHSNIVCTCGDALRNTDKTSAAAAIKNYVLATTFAEFFQSYNAIYNLGVKVVNDVLYVEPKADLYGDTTEIFDLGEVSDLKILVAEAYLVNLINLGYPDQRYDQRNGKYEFNSTMQFACPVTAVKRTYEITSKYRADCYGIEFIRGLANKDTTDNTGDKQVFMVNIGDSGGVQITGFIATKEAEASITNGAIKFDSVVNTGNGDLFFSEDVFLSQFTYINVAPYSVNIYANVYGAISGTGNALFTLKKNGVAIASQTVLATSVFFHVAFTMTVGLADTDVITLDVLLNGGAAVDITDAGMTIEVPGAPTAPIYDLKRADYDSITGVPDNTVFNVEEMTPHRQLLAHANYLHSVLFQQTGKYIEFRTGAKNIELSTTLDGVTITEKANKLVDTLADPLFLPYIFEFTCKSPYFFSETLAMLAKGNMRFTYNGNTLYCLPIGECNAKPGTSEAQTWKLIASPLNNLAIFLELGAFGLLLNDDNMNQIFISDLNPFHFIKYDFTPNEKYHHKDVYDDWVHQRFESWRTAPAYSQKWQQTDTVRLQIITSGVGALTLSAYDSKGKFIISQLFIATANAAIPLPFICQQLDFDMSDFDEGYYLFVLSNGETNLAITEWQHVKTDHSNTYLFEYSNTYNKQNAYFNSWGSVQLRMEAKFRPWEPESTFVDYEDEPGDVELLDGVPSIARKLLLGPAIGMPEFMMNKANEVLLLNRVYIEGEQYTRVPDSKLEIIKPEDKGYTFYYAGIVVKRALNTRGLTLTDVGGQVINGLNVYTIDATAFGRAEGAITIEASNE